MAFTNSPLVSMVSISPNRNIGRYDIVNGVKVAPITKITKITIHHWAGVGYLDTFKNIVMNPKREMSANYAIDVKGDGNCGYCAISLQLYGVEEMHTIIRKKNL